MMKLKDGLLDRIGICASLICVLHCILTPVVLLLGLQTTFMFLDQHWLEMLFVLAAAVIGGASLIHGFLNHRQHFIPVLFIAGILLLVNGLSVPSAFLENFLTISGALIITYSHSYNMLLIRQLNVSTSSSIKK